LFVCLAHAAGHEGVYMDSLAGGAVLTSVSIFGLKKTECSWPEYANLKKTECSHGPKRIELFEKASTRDAQNCFTKNNF